MRLDMQGFSKADADWFTANEMWAKARREISRWDAKKNLFPVAWALLLRVRSNLLCVIEIGFVNSLSGVLESHREPLWASLILHNCAFVSASKKCEMRGRRVQCTLMRSANWCLFSVEIGERETAPANLLIKKLRLMIIYSYSLSLLYVLADLQLHRLADEPHCCREAVSSQVFPSRLESQVKWSVV